MDSLTFSKTVDAIEFQKLAVSRKNLVRADDWANNTYGLLDPVAGICYTIKADELFDKQHHSLAVAAAVTQQIA